MTPHEHRSNDRTSYYTMKTPPAAHPPTASSHSHSHSHSLSHSHSHSHSHSNSQSLFANKPTPPLASPRPPFSVGQQYPPKLSPGPVARVATQDARTPSPNYFGLSIDPTTDLRESAVLPRDNWSPPTSSVKSFAAAIPKQLPLEANPEFEAFKKQVDANRGRAGFNLSTSHFGGSAASPTVSTPSAAQRPRPPRWHTHDSNTSDSSLTRPMGLTLSSLRGRDAPAAARMDIDNDSLQDSAYVSADSKRNSEASLNPPIVLHMNRFESPAQMDSPFGAPDQRRSNLSRVDDHHPRLSLVHNKLDPPTPGAKQAQPRADTVPPRLEAGGPSMMAPATLKELLETGAERDVLLLDLRVSPQYGQSRIKGALNLCIPTTLLKRATFNLQKLQQTFQADGDQQKFAAWRDAKYLVVYDAFSSEKRDAVSAMNMLKKFSNEGYTGSVSILRGGFNKFAAAYPELVDQTSGRSSPGLSLGAGGTGVAGGRPTIAPVIGGVMLPNSSSNPNPFFNNIRQNQDLVDGVGQLDIGRPSSLDVNNLPKWLREAAAGSDHGKKVSDKFLNIELTEQSRMKNAYTLQQPNAAQGQETKIQISGIEKGGKNRYKDILPFEHARVRLLGKEEGACDYVNASHIRASRSHKRYIASQGPLPATFDDFWSVIWDQDVRVIVMLTAESEGGQLKCHPYWKGREFGPLKLRSLSEKKVSLDIDKHRSNSTATPSTSGSNGPVTGTSTGSSQQNSYSWTGSSQAEVGRRRANTTTTLESSAPTPSQPLPSSSSASESPYVIIRKFALSHAAHPFAPIREITHLHYPSWPDFGAPAQPSHLLALVELANVMQRAALPIDVPSAIASSAGSSTAFPSVSRSGTEMGGRDDSPTNMLKRENSGLPLSWHDSPETDSNPRPMLVHCSAGCGRTGAFCTVDSVIDMLKRQRLHASRAANLRIERRERKLVKEMNERAKKDAEGDIAMGGTPGADLDAISPSATPSTFKFSPADVAAYSGGGQTGTKAHTPGVGNDDEALDDEIDLDTAWLNDDAVDLIARTVEDFRTQRLSMVQSLRQFVLCYETVMEWIWRLQEKGGAIGGVPARGRLRSGSLAM